MSSQFTVPKPNSFYGTLSSVKKVEYQTFLLFSMGTNVFLTHSSIYTSTLVAHDKMCVESSIVNRASTRAVNPYSFSLASASEKEEECLAIHANIRRNPKNTLTRTYSKVNAAAY